MSKRRDQSTTDENDDKRKKKNNDKKILLVDDEPDIIYSIKKVLEINGFVVDSYTDPVLALSNFKPRLYDLLLLDIKMPKIDGFDLHQKMKKIDSNVKICFLTASELFYEEYRKLDTYPTLDKAYFIQKPCRGEELVRHLNEILDSQIMLTLYQLTQKEAMGEGLEPLISS